MRQQIRKLLLSLLTIFFLGSLLTSVTWYKINSHVESHRQPLHKKNVRVFSERCENSSKIITDITKRYAQPWKRQKGNYQKFSSLLNSKCHGAENAIVTQNNTPLGSQIIYSGEPKRTIKVTPDWFSTFPKEHPFSKKKWDSCSVVGNGGILADSKCGEKINSAQFIIRCNIPPLDSELEKDVGKKTSLVTANPSIFIKKFSYLTKNYTRPFVESMRQFGDAMLLLPTFSFAYNTRVSRRAFNAIKDLNSPIRPVVFNPEYLRNLSLHWRSQRLKEARLSTGFMMVNLALELCNSVDLYGFWPFGVHPQDCRNLTNHYYDDVPPRHTFHSMPAEFDRLLKLHSQGILRIHLGDCESEKDVPAKRKKKKKH
ncbi:alpha-2,8-sialyltransferase 8F-like [Salarias fasciatus]|uniref:Alpha-2,8-sialyltransferase 8F-like n=1 Tax=Salarias fasciatus TaxID=181472 RepID=A0A672GLG2_SALFA|nr:alpha-2,8-sialyltransferase 8F-like [Salarias fasciatus]